MNDVAKSLWSVHIAVALLGATALFSKIIPLSATDITFARSLIAMVFLVVLVKATGGKLRLNSWKDYRMAVILGVLMAVHWVTYFAAMQYSSVSVGMIALFTFPIIVVLLEPIFEGIKLVWQDILSVVTVFVGIFMLIPEVSLENDVTLGVVVGVISAFLYAVRNLLHRKHFSHYSGATAMSYQTLIIMLCLIFFVSDEVQTASTETYVYLLILGTFCTAMPHSMVASSLRHLRAKTFALIACAQPLYGVGLAVLIIDEEPRWQTLLGGVLVISAAVYETVNTHKQTK
ncbi:DMT family transporter [Alteromonadaceae bacterium M269]|nr:DMT family transporter [Alteromonadaceae bacterium M269]